MVAWRQFLEVALPYWRGDRKKTAWALMAVLIALMLLETQLAVLLIDQSGEMTSALAARDSDRFWNAVQLCLLVLAFAVPVYVFYYYVRDAFSNHWRRWLTHRFLDGYLGGRRYYELGYGSGVDNPDQRISEDINSFTGRSVHFMLILLGSLMQLVAFAAHQAQLLATAPRSRLPLWPDAPARERRVDCLLPRRSTGACTD